MFLNSITNEQISELPLTKFEGKIVVVDNQESFDFAIPILKKYKILGFDTETKPQFTKNPNGRNKVALLQLACENDYVFLFRINIIGLMPKLANILASPKIQKVGLAIGEDIKQLQRIRQFKPSNFIDIQKIVGSYGIIDKSLKKIAAITLSSRISKKQQLSNWENEILTTEQQLYAATDAWISYNAYIALLNEDTAQYIDLNK